MEVPNAMISDAIKKKAVYTYYMAKKVESEKAKIVDEPEEQHVSPVKCGRGKGFMCYGDQVVNVPNKLKKDDVPRKTRSQTIVEETVVGELANSISIQEPRRSQLKIDSQLDNTVAYTYAEWGQKLKGPAVDDPEVQSLLDLRKGSKASRLESLKQKKPAVAGEGSSVAHNKYYNTDSDATLYSSSSDKTEEGANKTDDADKSDIDLSDNNPDGDDDAARYGVFMHNKSTATPNFTYLSSTVTSSSLDFIQTLLDETPANELTDFISYPVYIDAQTTSVVHNPKENLKLTSYISCASEVPLAKKLMQKAKKNMRKINIKKAVAQKFREYDQKLESLINFNVFEAFEKAIQARVLTEIKKLLPTHIPKAVANYVRPHHDALNAQDAELSFHKRSHDNQDSLNNREGENKKKRRKDVGEPSSISSRQNKSPHPNPEWFPNKSGLAKRRTTWFDLLLKSDIDQNENHILGPSIVAIAKKLKAIIQKDELTIPDLEGARLEKLKRQYQNDVKLEYHVSQFKAAVLTEAKWNSDEDDVSKPRTFERHMSKNTKPHPSFYNNDFYYLLCLSIEEKYTTSITKHYAARYYKQGI
ncbi:hypothetical protein Tco_0801719 [Tanacetum coccineum]|uniref:Uncharacterized protein n=1 Tax=Tanacetum coccineum TaxID=301880 RepID=A0ABQ4ZZ28_9ASTR